MGCYHDYAYQAGCDSAFTVDASRVTFGRGCLAEVGDRARALGLSRVALFTDAQLKKLPHFERVRASLAAAGVDAAEFSDVKIEPTEASFDAAIRFAREAKVDGYVSLGGGSVMDTCKAANLYVTHPAPIVDYVNAPIGGGRPVPGALRPHIACPTTSGTGSEVTGIAVFDLRSLGAKTGIAHPALRPTEALIDPDCTDSLPSEVLAASGFDVLAHALESFTARPFTHRAAPASGLARPMTQGANPWSDLGCGEALRLLGIYFGRAVHDATDRKAREKVMWAATLAGIAFGNAGVHVPHAMGYALSKLVRDFRPRGYPQEKALVPHGMSVILNAPSVFRYTASACPERHLEAAGWLGAEVRGARNEDAGDVIAQHLARMMRDLGIPNGIAAVGYEDGDLGELAAGTLPQQRLLQNAPREIGLDTLEELFRGALRYWT